METILGIRLYELSAFSTFQVSAMWNVCFRFRVRVAFVVELFATFRKHFDSLYQIEEHRPDTFHAEKKYLQIYSWSVKLISVKSKVDFCEVKS